MARVYLSPPDVGSNERDALLRAFDSNWIAPLGPEVDAFERELAARAGVGYAAALNSGSAGLVLGLRLLGVLPGDLVIVPTLTFCATANAVVQVGASPVFVDCDHTLTLDPRRLEEALEMFAGQNRSVKAVLPVDLYGQPCDYASITELASHHRVSVLQDAAEALGATHRGAPVGGQGAAAVFSFNGNKIITTSGGGALVSDDEALVERARFLASQARDPAPHYEHSEVGYNFRLSNLLAALGRAQLNTLDDKVARRRAIFHRYSTGLAALPGVALMPEAEYGTCTRWLTCVFFSEDSRVTPERMRLILQEHDIEARPVWKPMHLQPIYRSHPAVGGAVAEDFFARGLCLPSGSSLTQADQDRIISLIVDAFHGINPPR